MYYPWDLQPYAYQLSTLYAKKLVKISPIFSSWLASKRRLAHMLINVLVPACFFRATCASWWSTRQVGTWWCTYTRTSSLSRAPSSTLPAWSSDFSTFTKTKLFTGKQPKAWIFFGNFLAGKWKLVFVVFEDLDPDPDFWSNWDLYPGLLVYVIKFEEQKFNLFETGKKIL